MASNITKPKSNKKCTHCQRQGHSSEKCWKRYPNLRPKRQGYSIRKSWKKNTKLRPKNKNSRDDIVKPSETTLITEDTGTEWALSTCEKFPISTWLLDSGTTKHICAYKALFTELKPCETTLKWGNASTIKVNWSGNIRLRFKSTGRVVTINDYLYIPEIGLNLLSLG